MPIGAALGGAAIAGVGTVAAGALGAGAQKDAANTAAQTSAANTAANDELLRQIHDSNEALLTPYSNMGLQAGNALNDLLLGTNTFNPNGPTNMGTPLPQSATGGIGTGASAPAYTGPSLKQIAAMKNDGIPGNYAAAMSAYNAAHSPGALSFAAPVSSSEISRATVSEPTFNRSPGALSAHPTTTGPTSGSVTAAPSNALSAFDRFKQGDNYQWRLNQGEAALNSKAAANGTFDSGAADKAIVQYGQNFASNELSNYMNLLAGQQAMGLSAAGAVAGVGTTYAGNVTAQNTAAANAAANAALASGQANAGMYGAIGQGVGQIGGALFQYGMGQQQQPAVNWGAMYNASNSAPQPVSFEGGF